MNDPLAENLVNTAASKTYSPTLASAGFPLSRIPLKAKGLLAFAAVLAYAVFLAVFNLYEKTSLLDEFSRLQEFHEIDDQLRKVEQAAFHTITAVYINAGAKDAQMGLWGVQAHFDVLEKANAELTKRFPFASVSLAAPENALARAYTDSSRAKLSTLHIELFKVKDKLDQHIEYYRQIQKTMANHYRTHSDSVAIISLLLGLLGISLIGAIIGLFFTRLTNDLHVLKTRALEIVKGYRGQPIPVSRKDEVGELMQAVNHMAVSLDERERELMIARQKYFHQEKMAAVGALAAGVAHEIGNPIAAMSGVVQEMVDTQNTRDCGAAGRGCRPGMLQTQIQRLAAITREISGYAAPQPVERQLLDLNSLVKTAAGLIGYDKRMRRVNLRLNLDSQLPAIYGVPDQLIQVIMNLLINAADALESVEDHLREITLYTEVYGSNVSFTVMDNGCGIDRDTLNRVFEAFFTTKSKGTGLGLSLCYSIVTGHGGTIEIDSTAGMGTRVQLLLPLPAQDGVITQ